MEDSLNIFDNRRVFLGFSDVFYIPYSLSYYTCYDSINYNKGIIKMGDGLLRFFHRHCMGP